MPCSRPSQSIIRRTASRAAPQQVGPDPVGRVAATDRAFGRGARRGQELGRGHVQVLADRQPDASRASASRWPSRTPRRRPGRRGRRRSLSRAPAWKTGRNSVAPAVRCRVSMLPPWTSGGIVERGPVDRGDADLAAERDDRHADPRQELGARRRPRGSARDPQDRLREVVGQQAEAGDAAVQPQSAGSELERSTWSVSPGSAPSTAIGPVHLVDPREVEPRRGRRRSRPP